MTLARFDLQADSYRLGCGSREPARSIDRQFEHNLKDKLVFFTIVTVPGWLSGSGGRLQTGSTPVQIRSPAPLQYVHANSSTIPHDDFESDQGNESK